MRTRNRTPTHYDSSLRAKAEIIIELAKDIIRLNGGKDIVFIAKTTERNDNTDDYNGIQEENNTQER